MEKETKVSIIDFLSEFNYPKKQQSTNFNFFDIEFHKNDELIQLLGQFLKSANQFKVINTELLATKANKLASKINVEQKFKIIMFLIQCYHEPTSKSITSEYQQYLFSTGEALGFSNKEMIELITFQLADRPYTDRENAIYFNPNEEKMSYEKICVNHLCYQKEEITYLKYFNNSKICLTKNFKKVSLTNFLSNNIANEGIQVINEYNYNRKEFAFLSFNELIEKIENFNPLCYFELESNRSNPKVILDPFLGKVIISGKSSPVSSSNFFEPIIEWVRLYKATKRESLDFYIMLDHMNAYTSRFLVTLAKEAKTLLNEGLRTKLYWYCDSEDEDLVEMGQALENLLPESLIFCITDEVIAA